jgi:ribosome-binding factor A
MRQGRQRREPSRRVRRVASVIREVVSETLVTQLSDPRLAFVTVTGVDVSPDMRTADVRVSVMGDARAQAACLGAIQHAHGRLQERVAGALATKFCPILRFHRDDSVKRSVSISALIAKARAEDEAARADRIRRGVEDPADLAAAGDEPDAELGAEPDDEDDDDLLPETPQEVIDILGFDPLDETDDEPGDETDDETDPDEPLDDDPRDVGGR